MSWLSDIYDSVSGLFGGGEGITTDVFDATAKAGERLKGVGAADSFGFGDILKYGLPLAGTYFEQSQGRSNSEAYAQQVAAQLAAEKEIMDKKIAADLESARIGAGASIASANISAGAAKKNTLANLYSNWAQLAQRTGEAKAEQASRTGQNMNEGAVARAKVLI